jgi:hypothetical protein
MLLTKAKEKGPLELLPGLHVLPGLASYDANLEFAHAVQLEHLVGAIRGTDSDSAEPLFRCSYVDDAR